MVEVKVRSDDSLDVLKLRTSFDEYVRDVLLHHKLPKGSGLQALFDIRGGSGVFPGITLERANVESSIALTLAAMSDAGACIGGGDLADIVLVRGVGVMFEKIVRKRWWKACTG